jgi:NAD-dependent dihydropyrimidine dehydrogenase PreA subunit
LERGQGGEYVKSAQCRWILLQKAFQTLIFISSRFLLHYPKALFFRKEYRHDREKCTGCGICVAACPMDVIRLDESNGKAVVAYPDDCVACWGCESFCPVVAIDISPERGRGGMVSAF